MFLHFLRSHPARFVFKPRMIFGLIPLSLPFYQVKATAENVDEAVRELPDANSVRYSFQSFAQKMCTMKIFSRMHCPGIYIHGFLVFRGKLLEFHEINRLLLFTVSLFIAAAISLWDRNC